MKQKEKLFKKIVFYFVWPLLFLILAFSSLTPNLNTNNLAVNQQNANNYQNKDIIIQDPEEEDYWTQKLKSDVSKQDSNIKPQVLDKEVDYYYPEHYDYQLKSITGNGDLYTFSFQQIQKDEQLGRIDSIQFKINSVKDMTTVIVLGQSIPAPYWKSNVEIIDHSLFGVDINFNLLTIPPNWNGEKYKISWSKVDNPEPESSNIFANVKNKYGSKVTASKSIYNGSSLQNKIVNWVDSILIAIKGSSESYENTSKEHLGYDKIFMSENTFNNYLFKQDELENLVSLYDHYGEKIINNDIIYDSKPKINKSKQILEFKIQKIVKAGTRIYGSLVVALPITIVNFDYLLEASILSSSYWKHLESGEIRYHNQKPATRMRLSEQFIRAFYIYTKKQVVIDDIKRGSWNFVGDDQTLALEQAKSLALNYENYKGIKQKYQSRYNRQVLENLKVDQSLAKYSSSFSNISFNDFLYVLKGSEFTFEFGSSIYESYSFNFKSSSSYLGNPIWQGLDLKLSDQELRDNPNQMVWTSKVKNFKMSNSNVNNQSSTNLKIDLPVDVFSNYDLNLKYAEDSLNNTEIDHQYLFQPHGLDISDQISFVLADGTILDENYLVTTPGNNSSLKKGDVGYQEVRYWATFNNSSKQQEYLTVVPGGLGGSWFSPKYQKYVQQLDYDFNPKNLEYVFNQNVQLIISPYQNQEGAEITPETPQNFGIKRVTDTINGFNYVLEDWNDGKWSHTTDKQGFALFDGIFGSDLNGYFDPDGLLTEGIHHINIELQNIDFEGLKNELNIVVDTSDPVIKVTGVDKPVTKLTLNDDNGKTFPLYYSNGPIQVRFQDQDLASVSAGLIDANGLWYDMPINIRSQKIDHQWMLTINSIIDYAGFARIIIKDQAGNQGIYYFWLEQKVDDVYPSFDFTTNSLLDDQSRKLYGEELLIFHSLPENSKNNPTLRFSSPLITGYNVDFFAYQEQKWNNQKLQDGDVTTSNYNPNPDDSSNYDYGKTIDSGQSVLKYAGDELKNFLNPTGETSWKVTNKKLQLNREGLYKIVMTSRLLNNILIEKYIYINDQNLEVLDTLIMDQEQTNFSPLPNEDQGELMPDEGNFPITKEIKLNIPTFMVKKLDVKFSYIWTTDWQNFNYPWLVFNAEGKYKITLTDIFGQVYTYQILVLNKDLSDDQRNDYSQIYDPEKGIENSPFWKGEMVWNLNRYEDKDYVEYKKTALPGGKEWPDGGWPGGGGGGGWNPPGWDGGSGGWKPDYPDWDGHYPDGYVPGGGEGGDSYWPDDQFKPGDSGSSEYPSWWPPDGGSGSWDWDPNNPEGGWDWTPGEGSDWDFDPSDPGGSWSWDPENPDGGWSWDPDGGISWDPDGDWTWDPDNPDGQWEWDPGGGWSWDSDGGSSFNPGFPEWNWPSIPDSHFPSWDDLPSPTFPDGGSGSGSAKLSAGSIAGIVAGSVVGASMLASLTGWLLIKRVKMRKIR